MAEATWGELLNQAKGQLDLVPDGDYNVKIIDAQATNATTGARMFKVKVEITEGPNVKRRVSTNLVVSPENPMALAIFFRNMENIGIGADFFAQNPSPDAVASVMLNRPARVKIGHKAWQGVDRNEVQGWLPPMGAQGGAPGLPGAGGPVAPGTVIGAPGPVLPTSATPSAAAASTPSVPTDKPADKPATPSGPVAPTDAPPALPI